MSGDPIRVLVVDDHPLFRRGLVAALDAASETTVVGEAETGAVAVELSEQHSPDVVLMDINMDGMNGIEATRRLTAVTPAPAVVMLTMIEEDDALYAALAAGARGYLLKGAGAKDVVATVRAAAAGDAHFSAPIADRLGAAFRRGPGVQRPFPRLTEREYEVLELIARGLDNATIAQRLFLSPKTVSNHVSSIFAKLQVADRAQAIVAARQEGVGVPAPE